MTVTKDEFWIIGKNNSIYKMKKDSLPIEKKFD